MTNSNLFNLDFNNSSDRHDNEGFEKFDTHMHTLRLETATYLGEDDPCCECGCELTAQNDGGGIEIVGEGWVCTDCDDRLSGFDADDDGSCPIPF